LAAAAAISIAALLPQCPDAVHLNQARVQKQNFTSYFCTMPSIKHNNALQSLTVKQLQQLLQQKGLPVTGRKSELKVRLNQAAVENQGPKPKPWQHSTAKKDLYVGKRVPARHLSSRYPNLSVVPTSTPEGFSGDLEVFGCNKTSLLFYLYVELQNYGV